jgi:uncharacterized protein (TIGR02145 family)
MYHIFAEMKKAVAMVSGLMIGISVLAQNPVTVKDIDGNEYPTVTIGSQIWMAENLKTSRLNDGTSIPLISSGEQWAGMHTPAYTWYDNNEDYKGIYGALYNWYAVGTENLCPSGWHIPGESEWSELTAFLGGETLAGGKMKSTAHKNPGTEEINAEQIEKDQPNYEPDEKKNTGFTDYAADKGSTWKSPNTGASNESGFSAVPGGHRTNDNGPGVFAREGEYAYWWSATPTSQGVAWFRLLYYNYGNISRLTMGKTDGMSVRCVKD